MMYPPGTQPIAGAAPGFPTYQPGPAAFPMFPPGGAMMPGGFPPAGAMMPGAFPPAAGQVPPPGVPGYPAAPPPTFEESYVENILRLNLGKIATIYMTFENNTQWNAKIFRGRVEAAGRDHIIISDPETGLRYLLLMVNLDYITFEEELNYFYPSFAPAAAPGR